MWQELYFESNTLKTGQNISLCFSTYTMDHSTIVFSLLVDKFIPCLKHIHKLPLKTQYSRGGPKTKWTKIGQNSISPSSRPPLKVKKIPESTELLHTNPYCSLFLMDASMYWTKFRSSSDGVLFHMRCSRSRAKTSF